MKQFHLLNALVPVLLLVTLRGIFAVGRGPPRASTLGATGATYQGPSPAELEEQEEEDGNQDQDLDQVAQSPVQIFAQPPADITATAGAATRPEASFAQNPPGPRISDQGSKAFLSNTDAGGQAKQALLEETHVTKKSQASESVDLLRDAAARERQADLELSALSAAASSIPSAVQPEKAFTDLAYSDASVAKPFFSAAPLSVRGAPLQDMSLGTSKNFEPKNNFPAVLKDHSLCHPPCIQGRGICNDNICFCKTPFIGTTCQHKISKYSRVTYPMLVAASGVCLVMGLILAQVIHGFVTKRVENRLHWLGDGMVRQEVWMPPDNTKKKGAK